MCDLLLHPKLLASTSDIINTSLDRPQLYRHSQDYNTFISLVNLKMDIRQATVSSIITDHRGNIPQTPY
jgi:hypothetical protein